MEAFTLSAQQTCTFGHYHGHYEYEAQGKNTVKIFEPLNIKIPKDALPEIKTSTLDFYKPLTSRKDLNPADFLYAKDISFKDFRSSTPVYLFIGGEWFQVSSGKPEWYDAWNCWCMVWICRSSSKMFNWIK